VAQDYIDSFDCGLQESHVVVMGRLSVFRWHLGFHSSGPFDYVRTLVIPFKVRSHGALQAVVPSVQLCAERLQGPCCDQHAPRLNLQQCFDT